LAFCRENDNAQTGHYNASQSASVYVAGKDEYCKETAVSGYPDCIYASLDACQKHNKSTSGAKVLASALRSVLASDALEKSTHAAPPTRTV
jgi:hypothetical protein